MLVYVLHQHLFLVVFSPAVLKLLCPVIVRADAVNLLPPISSILESELIKYCDSETELVHSWTV